MQTVKPTFLASVPTGSTIERRGDGRVFVWYPKPERVVVRFVIAPCCPTCQRALSSGTVDEEMAI